MENAESKQIFRESSSRRLDRIAAMGYFVIKYDLALVESGQYLITILQQAALSDGTEVSLRGHIITKP